MLKKSLEASSILNVMLDKICVIEKQLCTYVCAHMEPGKLWKTNHLLFLAYRNIASALPLGMESVDRYKFLVEINPHYCSDKELKELGL